MNLGLLEKLIYNLLSALGIHKLFQLFRSKNKVCILLYHDPSPDGFRMQIQYLKRNGYSIIPLKRLTDALPLKDFTSIPPKAVVITFDDGHKGNYALLEIIKEYQISPTIYVCSDIIDTNRMFWFQWIQDPQIKQNLKSLPHTKRMKALKSSGFNPLEEHQDRYALSLSEIREMQGYFDFQSHTRFHPILTSCSDIESRNEISDSKHILESKFGMNIDSFAYPNGNYGDREIEYVKLAGYRTALTVEPGLNHVNTDPYKLKRYAIKDAHNLNELKCKISGALDMLLTCIHKF
jgi:poly-beta-1,6-N-acetyl-D-glucosamine N-deacetylase